MNAEKNNQNENTSELMLALSFLSTEEEEKEIGEIRAKFWGIQDPHKTSLLILKKYGYILDRRKNREEALKLMADSLERWGKLGNTDGTSLEYDGEEENGPAQ